MMRRSRQARKPQLEALEERWCPAKPGAGSLTNPALVFEARSANSFDWDLFLTTADGSATRQLTFDDLDNIQPEWSPDGARIAFVQQESAGLAASQGSLYSIKPDGTGLTRLYNFGWDGPDGIAYMGDFGRGHDWSPDGLRIVFAGEGAGAGPVLWVLDVASGQVRQLSTPVPGLVDQFYAPAWSPDLDPVTAGYQTKIAFMGRIAATDAKDIMVLDVTIAPDGSVQTGAVTTLNTGPGEEYAPAWSADGQFIAYDDFDTSDPGGPHRLLRIRPDGTGAQQLGYGTEPTWSPDGQYLAVANMRRLSGGKTDHDLFRMRADGSALTNVTRTDKRYERQPDWNPLWVNDLADALTAAAAGPEAAGETLTSAAVSRSLAEALARWQAAGVDTSSLGAIDLRLGDLGGTTLGLASGTTVWLDLDAAGWGWFVDPTPADDAEFLLPGDQGEQGHMDLLTVLLHELGHLLGRDHAGEGVMDDSLPPGTRRAPGDDPVRSDALPRAGGPPLPADLAPALLSLERAREAGRGR